MIGGRKVREGRYEIGIVKCCSGIAKTADVGVGDDLANNRDYLNRQVRECDDGTVALQAD
jgi:hypothetical protein